MELLIHDNISEIIDEVRDGKGFSSGRFQDEVLAIKLLSKDSTRTSTGIRLQQDAV